MSKPKRTPGQKPESKAKSRPSFPRCSKCGSITTDMRMHRLDNCPPTAETALYFKAMGGEE